MDLLKLWELIKENSRKQKEEIKEDNKTLLKQINEERRQQRGEDSKKVNETLDRVSEGIEETGKENREPVDKKIEDGREETELKEDKSILLSTNKNNSHKEDIKTMEVKTKKRHPRKLINTREELEMMNIRRGEDDLIHPEEVDEHRGSPNENC